MVEIKISFGGYELIITGEDKDVDLTTLIQDYSTDYKQYLYASSLVVDRLEKKGRVRFGCEGLCGRSSTVLLIALSILSLAESIPVPRIYIAYRDYIKQYISKVGPKECPETEYQRLVASSAIATAEAMHQRLPLGIFTASRMVFSGVAIVMEPIVIEGPSSNAYFSVFDRISFSSNVGERADLIRRISPLIMSKLKEINAELLRVR